MPDKKTTQTKRTTSVKSKSQPAPQSEIVRDPAADATEGKPSAPIGDYRGS